LKICLRRWNTWLFRGVLRDFKVGGKFIKGQTESVAATPALPLWTLWTFSSPGL